MAIAFLLTTSLAPGRGFTDVGEDEHFTVILPDYESQPVTVRVPEDPGGVLTAFATGFATEEDAYEAGRQMQSAIRAACVTTGMAIDVGTVPELRSALAPEMRAAMEQKAVELGGARRVVNYVHGVQVFDDGDLPVRYFMMSATGLVQSEYSRFPNALALEVSRQGADHSTDERLETARDLFMATDFEQSSRSKFLILVTALEVLAVQRRGSNELQEHIDSLITSTKEAMESATHSDEMEALIQALHRAREQSITSAIKEIAASAPCSRPWTPPPGRC